MGKPAEVIRKVPGEQPVRYTFTPEEQRQLGIDLAQAMAELSAIEGELETVKAQYKGKIQEASGRVSTLANHVRSGFEMRTIKVEKHMNLTAGTYKVVRLDTGEVIEERPLYESEKQIALEMGKDLPQFT